MLKRIKDFLNRRGKKPGTAGDPAPQARPAVQVGPRAVHRPIPESDLDPDAVKIIQRLTRRRLCPECGVNLNLEQCNCAEQRIDPRLAVLAGFHAENKTLGGT